VPPGYADHPEDERILLFPHTLTNDSTFIWRFIYIFT
jgi:hypothetical protein